MTTEELIGQTIEQRIDEGEWTTWGVVYTKKEAKAVIERINMGVHAINGGQNTCAYRIQPPDALDVWDALDPATKINILTGETTVPCALLCENAALVKMIKSGASRSACLTFINENW